MRWVSTRDARETATFTEAVLRNVPPGGGLYTPEALPRFDDWDALLALPFVPRSVELVRRLAGASLGEADARACVEGAFDFPVPLRHVEGRTHALELFHGPTLAFKDFGARFLARVLQRVAPGPRTVLTATSGDTGAAVASAFHGLAGVRVVVLYPRGRVSPLQERQMATLGGNVTALAVEGSFDDCQALVKACFADAALSGRLGLTSANSINAARLLAQVAYHAEAVAALRAAGEGAPPVVAVPSGNFGNLCAGVMAWRTGLPVRAFVVATNANRTVPDYLDGGAYRPRPSVPTLSSAMDVGSPSNWERLEALLGAGLRTQLRWGSLDDAGTREELRRLHALGYGADPHGAVASAVLRRCLGPAEPGVFLVTAHPAKFAEALEEALHAPVPLPPALARLEGLPVLARPLPADVQALRRELLDGAPAQGGPL